MRVAVWHTNHPISRTVSQAFDGDHFNTTEVTEAIISQYDCHIGYGILRGMSQVFWFSEKLGKPFFIVDRGYLSPSHYDGYYRISLGGTQQTFGWPNPDYERWEKLQIPLQPWRDVDPYKPVLVCPPTNDVMQFFRVHDWLHQNLPKEEYVIRVKGDATPINFDDYNYVLTFNSSVGWQGLIAGIPCVSDTIHSMVGSFFHKISLDELALTQYVDRQRLLATMSACQFTLSEIKQGDAWHYMCGLAGIQEKP